MTTAGVLLPSTASAARTQRDQALSSLADLARESEKMGAPLGAQRTREVCAHFDKLSARDAYQWLDPALLKREVEDANLVKSERWHRLRNIFSLLPLILTWLAISLATFEYQNDLHVFGTRDDGQTFLSLWQEGFHGADPLTFALTGVIDVVLLFLCLVFTWQAQHVEHQAQHKSVDFTQKLNQTTEYLMRASDALGAIMISGDISAQSVAEAVQRVMDDAMAATRTLSEGVENLVKQLQNDMSSLHSELKGNQEQVEHLTGAATDLTTAAEALAKNAGAYTKVGDDLRQQIGALDKTQQGLVKGLDIIAVGVQTTATDVSTVSRELTAGLKPSLNDMTRSVVDASTSLSSVTSELRGAAGEINIAAGGLRNINTDIAELDRTQKTLTTQLSTVGTGVSTSADAIKTIADQIAGELHTHIVTMGGNIGSATRDLQQYEKRMTTAASELERAATSLGNAAAQLAYYYGVPGSRPPVVPTGPGRKRRLWPFG